MIDYKTIDSSSRPRSPRGLVVVGISAFFHEASCCVLRDGRLVAAAAEERFTRLKHDPRAPVNAFRYCLREAGVQPQDVACLAYYEDPRLKLERQLWSGLSLEHDEQMGWLDPGRYERQLRSSLGFDGDIFFCRHHEAHAASAFHFSGLPDAALLTVDSVGEWASTTYGHAKGRSLSLTEEVRFPHSLGLLYSTLTSYLGFRVLSGEYKVMGLAPYGKPRYVDRLEQLITVLEHGQFELNLSYFDFGRPDRMFTDAMVELIGLPPRRAESAIDPEHCDLARSVQVVLERVLLEKVRYLHTVHPSRNLCMAGGVALNCVANRRIRGEGPFDHLFVQPAAGDAGGALGAAALVSLALSGETGAIEPMTHAYLGPSYSPDEIDGVMATIGVPHRCYRDDEEALYDAVVDRLEAGKVLGWFQGRMEFGPRALGSRSILADPRRPEMRDRLNELVKKREAFRPFAPSVLEEEAPAHFELDHPSRFMLETCQVRSPLDLPAITHVDGSARPQTVTRQSHGVYWGLIRRFHERTGCPLLVNTSFNVRGEPIVCSPVDALTCLFASGLDGLVLGHCVIDREALPRDLIAAGERRMQSTLRDRTASVAASIYTFV